MTTLNQRGITLIGVLTALFMLVVGVMAMTQLIARTQRVVGVSRDKLVAAKLATEGLEIVRAQRDTNWLKSEDDPVSWTAGLCGEDGDEEDEQRLVVDVDEVMGWTISEALNATDEVLYEATGGVVEGLWSHVMVDGEETRYRRLVVIDCSQQSLPAGMEASEQPELIEVSSKVSWMAGGEEKQVEVKEVLYNWYRVESGSGGEDVPIELPEPATGFIMGGFEVSTEEGNEVNNITAGAVGQVVMPWSNVDAFSLRFEPGAEVQREDIELRGVGTVYEFASFEYDSDTGVAVWGLAEPIVNDKLALMWMADDSPQLILRFDVLVGDANQDGRVDEFDVRRVMAAGFGDSLLDDIDLSGGVTVEDAIIVRNYDGNVLPEGEPDIE